jgi:hypothetical protein
MQRVAQAWLVLDLTGSSTAVGGVAALQFRHPVSMTSTTARPAESHRRFSLTTRRSAQPFTITVTRRVLAGSASRLPAGT